LNLKEVSLPKSSVRNTVNSFEVSYLMSDPENQLINSFFSLKLSDDYILNIGQTEDSRFFIIESKDQKILITSEHSSTKLHKNLFYNYEELLNADGEHLTLSQVENAHLIYSKTDSKFRNIQGFVYLFNNKHYRSVMQFKCSGDNLEKLKSLLKNIKNLSRI